MTEQQHPLTDKILEKFDGYDHLQSQWLFGEKDMRAAADWQLEQVIKWIKDNLACGGYLYPGAYFSYEIDVDDVIEDLKEAMRPQEENS
jgi:hypothetical protein